MVHKPFRECCQSLVMAVMKVYLRRGHHSVYDDLTKHPPKGIGYVTPRFVSASGSKVMDSLKKRAFSAYLHALRKPHAIYVNSGNADLIHACSGIMIKNHRPWIIDTEHVASFAGFEAGRLEKVRPAVEKLLSSEYCRKIMPWSEAGRMSIMNGLNAAGFDDKIEVVYPAIEPIKIKREKHDKLSLLFISMRFFTKGGKELLEAYGRLQKKYDIELTVISSVPEELRQRYSSVRFLEPNVPRTEILANFFPRTDIFVLPSYMDTFGMVFLEAMASRVPVVAANTFAIPEILGKSGICVDASKFSWYGQDGLFAWKSWKEFERYCEKESKPEVVDGLEKNISKLIEDPALRRRMGASGRREVEKGRFSLDRRNSQLKRIYEEAARH
ncbi:MAG: glycosyltransferase family 4 protein [Candidatus Aenigmarchaeota archaeon]|nr:glycosyltransferase family 4 protein [Candidatus Aenigmarchaeota archaeon]